jgi:hypothetical protein
MFLTSPANFCGERNSRRQSAPSNPPPRLSLAACQAPPRITLSFAEVLGDGEGVRGAVAAR